MTVTGKDQSAEVVAGRNRVQAKAQKQIFTSNSRQACHSLRLGINTLLDRAVRILQQPAVTCTATAALPGHAMQ